LIEAGMKIFFFFHSNLKNFQVKILALLTHLHSSNAQYSMIACTYEHYKARLVQLFDKIHSKNLHLLVILVKLHVQMGLWRFTRVYREGKERTVWNFTLSLSHQSRSLLTFPCCCTPHTLHISFSNVSIMKIFDICKWENEL
jgi:hypothetical protein